MMRRHLSSAVAIGLLLAAAAPSTAQQTQIMPDSQATLINNLLPGVVNITVFRSDGAATSAMNAAASVPSEPKEILGSGFVIDPSGVIMTNQHVIAGAYDIQVLFSDGVRRSGHVIATSPRIDLALIKVEAKQPLPTVHWGNSDDVRIGEPVFAVGNPLGIGVSVTSGIISGLNRNLLDTPFDDFIQTDAAINHGNSGGPLFNRRGEVIGIDTAIISPTNGSAGLGFAIPSNDAAFCATHLLHDGTVRPGYLGVKIGPVTQDIAAALGMKTPMGSIISELDAKGPAAAAGMHVGDVILRYDNRTPPDERALMRAVARSSVGQPVFVTMLREGHAQTLQITPADWPGTVTKDQNATGPATKAAMLVPNDLGLDLKPLTEDARAQYGLRADQNGVVVAGVVAGTDAFDRFVRPGDVIVRVQDTDVDTAQAVQHVVDTARTQHKPFVLALVLPKVNQVPGPHWMALRVADDGAQEQP
jgi:serine protease Do